MSRVVRFFRVFPSFIWFSMVAFAPLFSLALFFFLRVFCRFFSFFYRLSLPESKKLVLILSEQKGKRARKKKKQSERERTKAKKHQNERSIAFPSLSLLLFSHFLLLPVSAPSPPRPEISTVVAAMRLMLSRP